MSMDQLAEAALERFGLSSRATATLCNVSENHTYRVDDGERTYALRVHRPGYRTAQQIASELHWSDALRDDGAVDTPVTVDSVEGERVAPGLTLVTVSMIGAAGRVYLAGETADIVRARDEIERVLEGVAGRDH